MDDISVHKEIIINKLDRIKEMILDDEIKSININESADQFDGFVNNEPVIYDSGKRLILIKINYDVGDKVISLS